MRYEWKKRLLAAMLALMLALPGLGLAESEQLFADSFELPAEITEAETAVEELEEIDLFDPSVYAGEDGSESEPFLPPEDAETVAPGDTSAEPAETVPAVEAPGTAPEESAETSAPEDMPGESPQVPGAEDVPGESAEAPGAEDVPEENGPEFDANDSCAHALYVDYATSGEKTCASIDAKTHGTTMSVSTAALRCRLCGEEFESAGINRRVTVVEPHNFYKLNSKYLKCADCGYKRKICAHKKYHALNGSKITTYVYYNGRYHLKETAACSGYADGAVACDSCGMRGVKSGKKVNWDASYVSANLGEGSASISAALEGHSFTGGICDQCGMWKVFDTIALNATQLELGVKETFQLKVNDYTLKDGSGISFSTSSAAVATVDANTGKITAKAVGTATVTVRAEYGPSARVTVTVKKAPKKLTLSAKSVTLGVGETFALTATPQPADAASAITFTSGKKSVATVDANGKITGVKKGKATITAKTFNGKKATCKVTVKAAPTSISLSPSSLSLSLGMVRTPTVKLNSGSAGSWRLESSNPDVVAVEGKSLRAVGAGSAKITAVSYNGKTSAAMNVSVSLAPGSLALAIAGREGASNTVTLGVGEKLQLSAVLDRNVPVDLSYVTSNKAAATVSAAGLVKAKKAGNTVITVTTHNGLKASCTVKVLKAPKKVTLKPAKQTIHAGDTLTLTATLPSGAASAITFSSSKPSVVEIVSSANGVCTVRALKKGTATITAKTFNKKKATCKITVKAAVDPTGLSLSADFIGVPAGGSYTLTASLAPAGVTRKGILWTSANTAVARVEDGVVRGVAQGETTITATAEGNSALSASCRVVVSQAGLPVPVNSVTLSGAPSGTLRQGDTVALAAQALPLNAAYRSILWSSSDSAVASVSSDGVVTALKDGSAVITALAADGRGAADSVTITVRTVTYRALLVSESDFYRSTGWEHIKRNKGDVTLMQSMLKGVRGAEGEGFSVTTRDNTTKAELKSLVASTFANADENDVSLFFIATHGNSSSSGANAAALSMYSPSAAYPEYLKISELRDWLLAVPGKVIVVLESCGAGGAIYENGARLKSSSGTIRDELSAFGEEAVQAFAEADPGVYEDAPQLFANTGELRISNKFYVLAAAMYLEDSYGWEGGTSGNFFTRWLVEGVGKSGSMPADKQYSGNKNGRVDLLELYAYISGVGDDYAIRIGGVEYHQHVQVYPANTRYALFR